MTLEEKIKEGLRLIKEDKYPQALQVLGEAYIISPNHKELLDCIAFLWQRISEGDYDLIPETAQQFIMRGNARLDKKEYGTAYSDYSQAIKIDAQCDYAYKCRGLAMALQGNHKEAHKDYSIATKLNHNRGEYWDDAATSFEAIGDIMQAHLCHETAVKKSPDDARLWYNYGLFFINCLNDINSALEKFNKALEILPKFEEALVNRDYLLKIQKQKNS